MKYTKKFLESKAICPYCVDESHINGSITSVILLLTFFLAFGLTTLFASDVVVNSDSSNELQIPEKQDRPDAPTNGPRIIETGAEVIIDGSLRVLEGNYTKIFDLVEISTPVTPASNHARLFLTPGSGSTQQLSILFDDGTSKRITGN